LSGDSRRFDVACAVLRRRTRLRPARPRPSIRSAAPPPPDVLELPPLGPLGLLAGKTVTVADTRVVPPVPLHSNSNVSLELSGALCSDPLAALVPAQAPPATQALAPIDDQVKLVCVPVLTLTGLAVNCTLGGATTLTVTSCVALPPMPVQLRLNSADDESGRTVSSPCVGFAPVQGTPAATHDVAPLLFHSSEVWPPGATDVGVADKARVGGAGVPTTMTRMLSTVVPLKPVQLSE
jgi:hypothetical protein